MAKIVSKDPDLRDYNLLDALRESVKVFNKDDQLHTWFRLIMRPLTLGECTNQDLNDLVGLAPECINFF